MSNSFSVLGIEPTTDKSIIQKAYADLLKKYHPEEHPDEFFRIQKAYKNAMNYAKSVKIEEEFIGKECTLEPEPESKPEITPIEKSRPVRVIRVNELENRDLESEQSETNEIVSESIPDYIQVISEKVKCQTSNYNEMCSYIDYIMVRIRDKKNENTDKEIESLFNINEFCQIAVLPEFVCKLKEKAGYFSSGNLLAVQTLCANYKQLAKEWPMDRNLASFAEYWKNREDAIKKSNKKEKIYVFLAITVAIGICMFLFYNRNSYVFRDAPTTQQVSEILYARYGVEIPPEDISKVYVGKFSAPTDIGRAVSYKAVYKNGELEIPFHCVYALGMESPEELKSNLERAVFQEYYLSYLYGDFARGYDDSEITNIGEYQIDQDCGKCHNYSEYDKRNNNFYCELEIYSSNDLQEFYEQYEKFIGAFFKEEIVQKTGREYTFKIFPNTDLVLYSKDIFLMEVVVNADNYQNVLEVLKEKENKYVHYGQKIIGELLK